MKPGKSVAAAAHGTVELRIPAEAEWVAVARLAIAAVANRLEFSYEEIEDVKLAVAEACTNCIHHAAASDAIEIHCEVDERELRVRVRDAGGGARSRRARPAPVGDEPAMDGLGIFLIQSLMDSVEYHVDPKTGTELLMSKRVAP
ncbi:MAG: ATP-binding protein [Vulcanimicrobiaceae bacterium]